MRHIFYNKQFDFYYIYDDTINLIIGSCFDTESEAIQFSIQINEMNEDEEK